MLLSVIETIKATFALHVKDERKMDVSGPSVNIICTKSFAKWYGKQ